MASSSSGRYERSGRVYEQDEPVRILLVASLDELAYWVGTFERLTRYFEQSRGATVDIQLTHATSAQAAFTQLEVQGRQDLIVSRIYLTRVGEHGVIDFLRRAFVQNPRRMPSVILYDEISDDIEHGILDNFASVIEVGAKIECMNMREDKASNKLVRRVLTVVTRILDRSFHESNG